MEETLVSLGTSRKVPLITVSTHTLAFADCFAWVYADETTEAILQLFDEIRIHGAWVPGLWRWEIPNVLQLNVRRGRHSGDFRDGALASLALLPVKVDVGADRQAWTDTLLLAERHGLTVHDAVIWRLLRAGRLRSLRWTGI